MTASMGVAGVMSGTSADGVDVALCRIGTGVDGEPRIEVLGHRAFPYPAELREAVLGAMNAGAASVADLARLSWRLGTVYAECVARAAEEMEVTVELVGCHGQTMYHQGTAAEFLGFPVRATWQMGEAAVVAERMRCPVVSDFRPADMAAGGQGAPLVPMLDLCMFRDADVGRVLQNLGGIGNLTAIPAGAGMDAVMAFDTGPGNMVIDGCMRRLFGREFDEGGEVAAGGRVIAGVVEEEMRRAYFSAPPPKSCGREEFGDGFLAGFLDRCRAAGAGDADVVATATALTGRSILEAYAWFVRPGMGAGEIEYVIAGGGAKNRALTAMLRQGFEAMGVRVRAMEELGVRAEAKEAVAFALLAWLTWERRPGNVVRATGAARAVVLGKVSFGL